MLCLSPINVNHSAFTALVADISPTWSYAMRFVAVPIFGLVCFSLIGCNKLPADASANPKGSQEFGDVAFSTYTQDRTRLVFTTDSRVQITWANMGGDVVNGTYNKNGNEIQVLWDPAAENYGSLSEKFRQLGPCSMARYERIDRQNNKHDDPLIYQRTKPICDTVRVIN
jgi:hypothetical protein